MMVAPEDVRAQAKAIMDEFITELAKISVDEEFGIVREAAVRTPTTSTPDPAFAKRVLRNAPTTKDDCIVAEKKSW